MSRDHINDSVKRTLIQEDGLSDEREVRIATEPYQKDFPSSAIRKRRLLAANSATFLD